MPRPRPGEGAAVRAGDATACTDPYDINGDGTADAVCEGGTFRNGLYGRGMVDALDAVRW